MTIDIDAGGMVEDFEEKLAAARRELKDKFVPEFLTAYAEAKENAKRPVNDIDNNLGGLGSLYNEADYPTAAELEQCFGIQHSWFALSVPDELPQEIRERENAKLKDTFAQAQQEITYALREGFAGLVEHAIDRLQVKAGEKPKIFIADSMVEGFMGFFDTFRAKNLMDDAELEDVVGKAKEIVMQFAPNISNVKSSVHLRNAVAAKFGEVKSSLDALLKDRPSRKFDFND